MLEVYFLRDYFVEEALIKQSKGTGYPDFFKLQVYENEFLAAMEDKFGVGSPTVLDLLTEKLIFQFDIDKNENKKPKYYIGYIQKDGIV